MTRATNRRAVLGAVLAIGAAAATPPAARSASAKELTEGDRHALEQWPRYCAMSALGMDLYRQIDDAKGRLLDIRPMPDDIRAAHSERHSQIRMKPGGSDASMLRACREIEQAYMDGRLNDDDGLALKNGADYWRSRIARLPADDPKVIAALEAFEKNDRQLEADLAAYDSRKAAHEAELGRIGLPALQAENDRVADELRDLTCEILSGELRSPHALAAAVMIKIDDTDEETADILRASLAAIRPQLVGAIAEDADRVLAEAEEEEARS
jgi:hypothetical protein